MQGLRDNRAYEGLEGLMQGTVWREVLCCSNTQDAEFRRYLVVNPNMIRILNQIS